METKFNYVFEKKDGSLADQTFSIGRIEIGDVQACMKQFDYVRIVERRQRTWMEDNHWNEIFKWDIVRVFADRAPNGENHMQSSYDKKNIEVRATIVRCWCGFQLDIKNEFNDEILRLKWNEKERRWLSMWTDLYHYNFFQDSERNREKNSHSYDHKIEVIGNKLTAPGLLEQTK